MVLLSASVMLVCVRRIAAQTDNGIPAADLAPSPSGTGLTGATIGSVNIDRMMIGAQLRRLGRPERNTSVAARWMLLF
jgi:hypothetical protein